MGTKIPTGPTGRPRRGKTSCVQRQSARPIVMLGSCSLCRASRRLVHNWPAQNAAHGDFWEPWMSERTQLVSVRRDHVSNRNPFSSTLGQRRAGLDRALGRNWSTLIRMSLCPKSEANFRKVLAQSTMSSSWTLVDDIKMDAPTSSWKGIWRAARQVCSLVQSRQPSQLAVDGALATGCSPASR